MSIPASSQKESFHNFTYLLPFLPVIFFFSHNLTRFIELILTLEVLFLFIFYSLFSFLIFLCSSKILKWSIPFSLFLSYLLSVVFLFFGLIQDYLFQLKISLFLSNTLFLFACFTIVILLLSIQLKNNKKKLKTVNRFFTILFLALIVFESGVLCYKIISGKTIAAITNKMTAPIQFNDRDSTKELPDIYYFIFDSYTNRPALNKYWGYENDIYDFLNSKDFFTVDSATSNYKSTPYSISSVLNLQYLIGAAGYQHTNSSNFLTGLWLYRNNILYNFLKKNGYTFSNFSQLESEKLQTGFGFLGVEKPVTWLRKQTMERIYVDPWMWNKLNRIFGGNKSDEAITIKSMKIFDSYNKNALAHIQSNCNSYVKRYNTSPPLFCFTHFMLPHNPYLVDENGNYTGISNPDGENMNGYLGQVKYANQLIRQITNCLLSDTTRNKIIIFQGDHGYRHFKDAPVEMQFETLNAFYFYNKNYNGLRKDLSNVNTFRVVINNFFEENLLLLKDSIILSK